MVVRWTSAPVCNNIILSLFVCLIITCSSSFRYLKKTISYNNSINSKDICILFLMKFGLMSFEYICKTTTSRITLFSNYLKNIKQLHLFQKKIQRPMTFYPTNVLCKDPRIQIKTLKYFHS